MRRTLFGAFIAVLALLPTLAQLPAAQAQAVSLCPFGLLVGIGGSSFRLPYCASQSLETASGSIEQAIIVIHGATGDAVFNAKTVIDALGSGGLNRTLVIAPQFLTEEQMTSKGLQGHLFWRNEPAWAWGYWAVAPPGGPDPTRLSSFDVVDRILELLSQKDRLPRMKRIVVFGHSAGGQFVNRYASAMREVDSITSLGMGLSFSVANPSSYVYLGPERMVGSAENQFAIPGQEILVACPTYNDYGYGLNRLPDYLARTGPDRIREEYRKKPITYFLGGRDTDPNDSLLAKGCAAMLQGRHRLERGRVYFNHLLKLYGEDLRKTQRLIIVKEAGHDSRPILGSQCGRKYVIGEDAPGCRG